MKEKIRESSEAGIEYLILNVYAEREEAMVKLFADEVIAVSREQTRLNS